MKVSSIVPKWSLVSTVCTIFLSCRRSGIDGAFKGGRKGGCWQLWCWHTDGPHDPDPTKDHPDMMELVEHWGTPSFHSLSPAKPIHLLQNIRKDRFLDHIFLIKFNISITPYFRKISCLLWEFAQVRFWAPFSPITKQYLVSDMEIWNWPDQFVNDISSLYFFLF